MHTEDHIQVAGGVDPEPLDDRAADAYHLDVATGERQPAPPHARPLSEALSHPPLCAHGMNSFTDRGYGLGLARPRRG
jgi:hypothetical protein